MYVRLRGFFGYVMKFNKNLKEFLNKKYSSYIFIIKIYYLHLLKDKFYIFFNLLHLIIFCMPLGMEVTFHVPQTRKLIVKQNMIF
jgi:hypothetical protein